MQYFRLFWIGCLAGLLVFASPLLAQKQIHFDAYSVDDGLPQSSIWSILQDRNGFLWIGTADGVCRYDGYEFRKMQPDSGEAIKGILHLYEDRRGDIWITHQQRVLRYCARTGRMGEVYRIHGLPAIELYHKILGEDKDGNI